MGVDPTPLLDLRHFTLERRVPGGAVTILKDIDLCLESGQWLAVMGANGSGKSSLLKYLAGEDSPLEVTVSYMAQDPDEQIVAGTVAAEIVLGHEDFDPGAVLIEFGLEDVADLDPQLLSAGQKQRLNLAVATGTRPQVMLCDEPTSLQDETQSRWVLNKLDKWRQHPGRCLVTATCDRCEAERADWLVVLHEGRVSVQGPSRDLLHTPAVEELLTGFPEPGRMVPHRTTVTEPPVLTLQGVGCDLLGPGGGFAEVDLAVAPGQRVGITGVNGCGKSTLLAVCAGLRAPDMGKVVVADRVLYASCSQDLDHGLAMLAPQFPEYMFCRTTVTGELDLGPMPPGMDVGLFLAALGLDSGIVGRNPHDLSSGQRRRLAVGMVARSGRPLLLLDEPTAALDRQGRQQIFDILDGVGPQGALIIASHDESFLMALGCRIFKLCPGGLQENGLAAPGRGC